jgi:hypothetical protein
VEGWNGDQSGKVPMDRWEALKEMPFMLHGPFSDPRKLEEADNINPEFDHLELNSF